MKSTNEINLILLKYDRPDRTFMMENDFGFRLDFETLEIQLVENALLGDDLL